MNPRYLAYSRAHGMDPDAMLEHDRERWPGGVMCGFIVWIHRRWLVWDAEHGRKPFGHHSAEDHAAFDAWLAMPEQSELVREAA